MRKDEFHPALAIIEPAMVRKGLHSRYMRILCNLRHEAHRRDSGEMPMKLRQVKKIAWPLSEEESLIKRVEFMNLRIP